MPGQSATIGEYHRPGHIACRNAAPQFAIDEIGNTPEKEAEGYAGHDIIAHPQEAEPAAPRNISDGRNHPDHAAMKAHAALPQLEQIKGVGKQLRAVKDRIAQPPASNDTNRAPEKQILGMAQGHGRGGAPQHPRQMPIAQHNARQIGQRVIAQGEKAEINPAPQPQISPIDGHMRGTRRSGANSGRGQ